MSLTGSTVATGASAHLMPPKWMGWTRWDRLADACHLSCLCTLRTHSNTVCVTV